MTVKIYCCTLRTREGVQSRKASFPWLVGNKQSFARFFTRSEKLQFSRLIRHFLGGSTKQTRVKCINATFSHPIELLLELRKNSEKWPCCSIMKIDLGGHFTMFQKISHGCFYEKKSGGAKIKGFIKI